MGSPFNLFQSLFQDFSNIDTSMKGHRMYNGQGVDKYSHYPTVTGNVTTNPKTKTLKTVGSVDTSNLVHSQPGFFQNKVKTPSSYNINHSSYSSSNKNSIFHDRSNFDLHGGDHRFSMNGF